MEKVKTVARKWGNLFGIVLPRKIVDTEKIKEGTEMTITIEVNNKMTVGDLMEFARKHPLPKLRRPIQEIIEEVDRELWGEE
ncbi:AbrB/MazE/SpoVT family DNA-binding domain-containing protein [Candidatus Pacearchaeota archaeon]|nr:AbrB/MazE/SpoVT family DNA-binding domain-containing protein [Candidatus Pacearchaeota archaeon]